MSLTLSTILYAADMKEGSRKVFDVVINQAIQNKSQIIYVHAVNNNEGELSNVIDYYLPDEIEKRHFYNYKKDLIEKIKFRIHKYIEEVLAGVDVSIKFSINVQYGSPDKIILDTAKKCNAKMIIMGNRKTNDLSRIFFGATATKVLQKSEIPVLIVPII